MKNGDRFVLGSEKNDQRTRIHTHIPHAQLVALYCSKVLGKKLLALRVMKRIKIMEDELVRCMCVDYVDCVRRRIVSFFFRLSSCVLIVIKLFSTTHRAYATQASATGAEEEGA